MKYKNYRNPHTNDNKIYSFKDLYDMPFGELIKRKQEVLGQYRVLGVPTDKELQASENVVYVQAYTRDDGTEVKAHWRSKPDGVVSNNFSQGNPTGGASNIDNNYSNEIPQDYKPNFKDYMQSSLSKEEQPNEQKTEQVENETDERLYPKEIAGVKRGEPMTYEKAGGKNVNPNYGNGDERYEKVCQSCVACWEARMRGYDLEVLPYNETSAELATNLYSIYIDPITNKTVIPKALLAYSRDNFIFKLENELNIGNRYIFSYTHRTNKNENHVVCAYKTKDGKVHIYDAMTGTDKSLSAFANDVKISNSGRYIVNIVRTDDKILDNNIIGKITRKKTNG